MANWAYQPRIADAELQERLASAGAVVIEGPKACGKTATARQAADSEVLLDVDVAAREAAAVDPALLLAGRTPRLIDEWQTEPALWNHVRRAVDEAGPGCFILTGSALPADDITRHTGAGRISRLRLRTMTLAELGFSSAEVSLRDDLLSGAGPLSAPPAPHSRSWSSPCAAAAGLASATFRIAHASLPASTISKRSDAPTYPAWTVRGGTRRAWAASSARWRATLPRRSPPPPWPTTRVAPSRR